MYLWLDTRHLADLNCICTNKDDTKNSNVLLLPVMHLLLALGQLTQYQ